MENRRFPFLERSIRVLVVDDEPAVAALHFEHLNSYKLYDVARASSAKEADSILSSSKRYHVCMLDLGVTDFDHDEYYLVRKFSPKVSFIVVSGRESLEKGFQAGMCGALAAISKPVDFYKVDFIDRINDAFFKSLFIPDNLSKCKLVIKEAIQTFITFKPVNVKEWAEKIGMEERYLRKVWAECFDYPPKYVPWLYRIFYHAFSYYKAMYCREFRVNNEANDISAGDMKDREYTDKRFLLFYHSHKTTIDSVLHSKILSA